jgi:hypothetical protein
MTKIEQLKLRVYEIVSAGRAVCDRCKGVCCNNGNWRCAQTKGYLSCSVTVGCKGNYKPGQRRYEIGGRYYYMIDANEEKIEQLKKEYGWSDKDGFQGPSGCLLPAHKRSATCLGYRCSRLHKRLGKRRNGEIEGLYTEIRMLEMEEDIELRKQCGGRE